MAPAAIADNRQTWTTWEGGPRTKYAWYENIEAMLDGTSSAFRTMWEYGYAIDRGKVCVADNAHAFHLANSNVVKQNFRTPRLIGQYELAANRPVPDAFEPDKHRYVVSTEALMAKDRELLTTITQTISTRMRREDYEKTAGGSGLRLLQILQAEVSTSSAELGQYVAKQMAALVEAGIESPTIVGFETFREKYQSLNEQLPQTRKQTDSVIADVYAAAARALGDHIATRIDLRVETKSATE